MESGLISNDTEAVTRGCGLFIIGYQSALPFPLPGLSALVLTVVLIIAPFYPNKGGYLTVSLRTRAKEFQVIGYLSGAFAC